MPPGTASFSIKAVIYPGDSRKTASESTTLNSMIDIKTTQRHFLALNQERLKRTNETLRRRHREALDIIPLLFHANHPTFPGYVSANTPKGVANYTPSQRSLESAARFVKGFDYKRRAQPRYDIHSIFLMGSSGTIAHSEKSDFDIWICHSDHLNYEQLSELQTKAHAIEQWADQMDLEIHFFLMNARAFANGEGVELSSESSGSCQHHLLLDEFYRTGLVIAGRTPVWWLVPVEEESNYDSAVRKLIQKRHVTENEIIDFGGLPEVPAAEFFGASLWQLYKGIDSPYKSVLKIMLLEVYAASYPRLELLSLHYKRAIQGGETDLTKLDPYIMLYNAIAEYLEACEDNDRLELLRRCFYMKVNEKLSLPDDSKNPSWHRETLREMVESWGWGTTELLELDNRSNWRIEKVLRERRSLVATLTQSYNALSDFARTNNNLATIKQDDLNTLGRKLYAAFEKKPGKIDLINRGISDSMFEPALSLHEYSMSGQTYWLLYRGLVNRDDAADITPLHRSPTVVEMLCWCHFNQISNEQTAWSLHLSDSDFGIKEVRSIHAILAQQFPKGVLNSGQEPDVTHARAMVSSVVFVNICSELPQDPARRGHFLTSNKTDALSFGGISENHIVAIDQVIQTSWNEVMTYRYTGIQGILDCLRDNIRWSSIEGKDSHWSAPTCHCFSIGHGISISRRVNNLFVDVEAALGGATANPTRYVLTIGRDMYLLWRDINGMQSQKMESYPELVQYLGDVLPYYSPVVFDRYTLPKDVLPAIYHHHEGGKVHLYYVSLRNSTRIFVIDENGTLVCQTVQNNNPTLVMHRYIAFLSQCGLLDGPEPAPPWKSPEVACFQIKSDQHSDIVLSPTNLSRRVIEEEGRILSLTIKSQVDADDRPSFVIKCDDKTFSSHQLGDQLFRELAQYMVAHGNHDPGYLLRVTSIESVSRSLGTDTANGMRTSHLLNYRLRIEKRIDHAVMLLLEERKEQAV